MTVATSNMDSKSSAQIPAIPPITLTVDSNRRYLSTLKFNEPVDIQLLKNLLMIEGILSTANITGGLKTRIVNQRTQMRTLIKAYDAIVRVIKVTYQSANDGACTYGRFYPVGGASAGEVSKDIRSYLFYALWTALDIDNAHPTILLQVLIAHGFAALLLSMYCEDREKHLKDVMKEYKVDRSAAKLLFIRLMYLGEFKAWAVDNELVDAKATSFIKNFSKEMLGHADTIVQYNAVMRGALKPNERSIDKAVKKAGPGRPKKKQKMEETAATDKPVLASPDQVMSYFLQEHERRVLRHMFDFLVQEGLIDIDNIEAMLRYDGIDLPLTVLEGRDLPDVLKRMSKYVYEMTGLALGMSEKPYSVSPLKKEIDILLDFESKIPENYKGILDNAMLANLRTYPAQKYYFEKFISTIQFTAEYAWVQHSYKQGIDEAKKMTKRELIGSWEHIDSIVEPGEGDKDPTIGKFIFQWIQDQEKSCCNEVNFIPFNEDLGNGPSPDSKIFNLFRGFANPKGVVLDKPYSAYTEAFHYLGLQLCENDPWQYQFFWNCLVRQFKTPADRLDLAFVFQDKTQGTGADVFFDAVGGLFGAPYYRNSDKISDFLGEHAEGVENKLLVVMNELKFKDSNDHEARIKTLITATTSTINPKCVRPYPVDLYPLCIFTSNNESAINFDNDDNERRFVVWKPTRECIMNEGENWGYQAGVDFDYLNKVLFKSPKFLSALYKDVMETDIRGFNHLDLRKCALGAEYCKASERNAAPHAKFFADALRTKRFEGTTKGTYFKAPEQPQQPWEIDEVVQDRTIQIKASHLHDMYFEYVSDICGVVARKDTISIKSAIMSKYNVIRSYKNNVDMYEFKPRALWKHLVEKKWVQEHQFYDAEALEDKRKELIVDPRFMRLATLKQDTPVDQRGAMNPGKQRPI